jgi:hypothetical protein
MQLQIKKEHEERLKAELAAKKDVVDKPLEMQETHNVGLLVRYLMAVLHAERPYSENENPSLRRSTPPEDLVKLS